MMRARCLRPPMARMPASEIMIAKEQGLNPSTIPARRTVGSVHRDAAAAVFDSTAVPVTGMLITGLSGSSQRIWTCFENSPGSMALSETESVAADDGSMRIDESAASAPQQPFTCETVTGDGEALWSSIDFEALSPAAISPNATPSGGTASRGADKVESIGKQHRQQKTTILFMFCFSRVERVETCRTFEKLRRLKKLAPLPLRLSSASRNRDYCLLLCFLYLGAPPPDP